MDFWQWYVRRGRIDRRTWWLQYALPIGLLSVLALMADVALGNSSLESIATGETGYGPIVRSTRIPLSRWVRSQESIATGPPSAIISCASFTRSA